MVQDVCVWIYDYKAISRQIHHFFAKAWFGQRLWGMARGSRRWWVMWQRVVIRSGLVMVMVVAAKGRWRWLEQTRLDLSTKVMVCDLWWWISCQGVLGLPWWWYRVVDGQSKRWWGRPSCWRRWGRSHLAESKCKNQ